MVSAPRWARPTAPLNNPPGQLSEHLEAEGDHRGGLGDRQLARSRPLFICFAIYLFSQWVTIPVIGVGPWAMWPTLSDLSILAMVPLWFCCRRSLRPLLPVQRRLLVLLAIVAMGSLVSYCGYLGSLSDRDLIGVNLGKYQIYRMFQLAAVFGMVCQIPLDQGRRQRLSLLVDMALLCGVFTMFMTFFKVIPLGALTAHLPPGDAGGPWSAYVNIGKYGGAGWGAFGYNHAYVSIQLLMIMGLRLHLAPPTQVWRSSIFFCITVVACFFSGSRNGLALSVLYSLTFFLRHPKCLVWLFTGLLTLIVFSPLLPNVDLGGLENTDGSILERQATLFEAGDKDNLSGRDELWGAKIEFLNQKPLRWFFGGGFGSGWDSTDSGESAHLLPLHIVTEAGIIGLGLAILIFFQILIALQKTESSPKAVFWITWIFLISGVSQETFYPVPALLGFMHFYGATVAIALGSDQKF
ncbi:MAG: O-antigen ligase family protein [Synechococcales cyanobacterium RM1_1_8]|nr:O-antigen ligase family protein [Synechococcales cyanobacterium RM1_1_8]